MLSGEFFALLVCITINSKTGIRGFNYALSPGERSKFEEYQILDKNIFCDE